MTSWVALNMCKYDTRDVNVTQQKSTEEAQDAENAVLYEKALRCQHYQQNTQAKALYLQLLNSDFRLSRRLQYLCYKNLATMELEVQSFEDALEYFAAALRLDATDVVVWHQMARTAIETGKLWLARRLLEEGLKMDATYWPLVDSLALVLHQVGDEQEYTRLAKYLRQYDPQCSLMRLIGKTENIVIARRKEEKLLNGARKRRKHVQEIVERERKRRKELQRENEEERKIRLRRRRYCIHQASWMELGKLLLEVFDAINQDNEADVVRTQVQIQVGYNAEAEDEGSEERVKFDNQESDRRLSVTKTEKMKELPKFLHDFEMVLSTDGLANNTQESGLPVREATDSEPRRRKSRRHEERLREEHAAAVKKARENNLTYRLEAFLPVSAGNEDKKTTLKSGYLEWPLPLHVELIDGEFTMLNASEEMLLKTMSFAFTTATEEMSSSKEPSSTWLPPKGGAVHTFRAEFVTERQISAFINDGNSVHAGIIDWVRLYLNRCGQWSHLKLGSEAEDIHKVCIWLEKALKGDLDAAKAATSTQRSIINVAEHSLHQNSRFKGNGLSLVAQVFLLELRFDVLLQQLVHVKVRRKIRRLVDDQLAEAEKLLFAFGWLEDSEDVSCRPTRDEFLRLFWLMACMHERCGNHHMAQSYFTKCREKLCVVEEADGGMDDYKFRVDLTNQKANGEITLGVLDEKISGLRFFDVCSEARRLFQSGDHDHVVSVLLKHLFPCNQVPRMTDFLKEFEVDEDDVSMRGESNRMFDIVLQSLGQGSRFSDKDLTLFLLTTLYYVIEFLDGLTVQKKPNLTESPPYEACTSALAAISFLLDRLMQKQLEDIDQRLLLRGLCVKCLQPSILFRFDSQDNVLSTICVVLTGNKGNTFGLCDDDGGSTQQMIGVDAMARLLYIIVSQAAEKFQDLFPLVLHPIKKKHLHRDRIRVIVVELLRYLNRVFYGDKNIALSLSLPKRSALMRLCSMLMKEEEEIIVRRDGKMPRQLFGNGAILYLQLYESCFRSDLNGSPTQLVKLIHFLHQRLGHYGICGLSYFSGIGSGDSRKSSCFLEVSTILLSNYVQKANIVEKPTKKLAEESVEETDEKMDVLEDEYLYQKETCQCYRCLYDVQILPGCEDHKTGTTFGFLQNNVKLIANHEDAMRLLRFAVPIFLATKAKNNSQKKERLKLLHAVQDALVDSSFFAPFAQLTTVSPQLEAYLAPRGLLQEEIALPFPLCATDATTGLPDKVCVSHLWYLMGANYILGRAKRRGNLIELINLEQQVRERVEFLMKDVLYYHPDRIDSWVRLGKTMKELYHAATDAFAAVLGRKLRVRAFQWYTTKMLTMTPEHLQTEDTESNLDVFSFQNVVLEWKLFQKIKDWQGKDGHKMGSRPSTLTEHKEEQTNENDAQAETLFSQVSIEEYATTYIVQVIEFARRCFDMAVRLAEEVAKKHKLQLHSKRDNASKGASAEDNNVEKDLDDVQNTIVECNEECGLLLFNVLQEFSLIKELNLALFPHEVYSRLINKTLAYFQRGWTICKKSKEKAQEGHYRLHYMIGKTLKKRRWYEICQQEQQSDPEALSTAKEMADSFCRAESARGEEDREHTLVHAFYALQALRIDLTIRDSSSVSAMRLVCNHYYEEEEGDDVAGVGTGDTDSLAAVTDFNKKYGSQKDVAVKDANPTIATVCDTKCASIAKKDGILALLAAAERNSSVRELNVTLARGWLALNIIKALESIPNEDRYFHPSRYMLARIVYWLSTFCSTLKQSIYTKSDSILTFLDAVSSHGQEEEMLKGRSVAASWALKEMAPIFDKRRPQIVAIWFSEHIPTAKRFEELNQRQMKYDYYRLKYWRFYIVLLEENAAYEKLKEAVSWVVACKEDHDVIEIMLCVALDARGKVLRSRLEEMLSTLEEAERVEEESGVDVSTCTQFPGDDQSVNRYMKQLARIYTYYLEVLKAQRRLTLTLDDCKLLLENVEHLMVAVFVMGVLKYPSKIMVRTKDAAIFDQAFHANVTAITKALHCNELRLRICDAQGEETWKMYLDAACSFCEEKWPERMGKGKVSKKALRPQTVATTSSITVSTTDS